MSGSPRPTTSPLRLPSLAWKGRKNNACFSGYWSRVLRFFWQKYYFSEWNKRQLNLWYPARCWSRASYHRLLLQQSQNRRRLHTGLSHEFLFYSVWERMLTPPSQWRVLSMCGRCLGRTTSSLGLSPLKMGEGRHPNHFLTKKPWGRSCKEKERHANTWTRLEAREGFLSFLPSALRAAIAFSRKAGYVRIRLKNTRKNSRGEKDCPGEGSPPFEDCHPP